jgi:hypothetical protein
VTGQKYGIATPERTRSRIVNRIIIPPLAGAGVLVWAGLSLGRRGKHLAGQSRQLAGRLRHRP